MPTTYVIYLGAHALDLTALQGKLVDIEEGGLQGLRTDKPGFAAMAHALTEAMPKHGAAAGIPQDVYDHFTMCNDTVDLIEAALAIAIKQVEVLKESLAFYVDARQNDVSLMVDSMKSRAQRRKEPAILIPFEAVLAYYRQTGDKAVQTRRKNQAAKAAKAAEQTEPPAEPEPAPKPV